MFAVITAVCLWGSSFIGSKIALQAFSPLLLCLVRFTISVLVLTVFRLTKKDYVRPSAHDLKYIILSAIAGISVYHAVETVAVSLTSASDASLISAAFPLIMIAVGIVHFRLKVTKKEVLGILAAAAGVIIVTVSAGDGTSSVTGNILMIACGFLWAFYSYLTQKISRNCPEFTIAWLQMVTGAVCFIPMLILEKPSAVNITPQVIAAVLFLSTCCSLLALVLYNYGLRGVKASTAASLMNLMPAAGVVLSALILHETITARQIIGGLIIFAGVYITVSKKRQTEH
ncbi:MAG: DMT family transporter [Solobacterium sp.]|nr:DMT family transporter [Solobacterium sp.]